MKQKAHLDRLALIFVVLILPALVFLAACGGSSSTPGKTGEVIVAGQGTTPQSKPVGQAFTLLQATVTNNGSPMGNVTVSFTAPSSGASGTFATGTATDTETTNANGIATATTFKANTVAGSYVVKASVTGVSAAATFSLTNTALAPAAITAVAGSNQSVPAGTAFAALQAKVVDSYSNPVSGVSVVFSTPATGASATFAGSVLSATVTTNSSGVAVAPALTAGGILGTYTVTASVSVSSGGNATADFALTNITGAAAVISASSGSPQDTTVGLPFLTTLQATVEDAFSNPIIGASVTFTAVAAGGVTGTFANGTATDTETTNADGVAISTTLTANHNAGCFSATASTAGVSPSASFTLGNVVPVIAAASGSTPQSATVETEFASQLQASVTGTACGSTVPLDGITVTFTAPASGASGTFADTGSSTTTAVTNALGLATAAAFTANNAAGSYKVTTSAPAVSAANTFSLTNTTLTTLAAGNYVFSLSGFNTLGYPYSVAGAFTINGGKITAGELDFVDYLYADSDPLNPATSNISQSTDGNFIVTLATCAGSTDCTDTDINVGVNGVLTLDAAFLPQSSMKQAFVTEFDSSASGSGALDFQTSTTVAEHGYAFGLNGLDTFANPIAIDGVVNVDGSGTISGTGSIFDANDDSSGSAFESETFAASTVSPADSFGRVEFTLNPSDSTDFPQIVLAGYVADSNHLRLVEINDSYLGDLGGNALNQGANTGTFGSSSISGASYVVGLTGSDTAGSLQAVGLLTFNSGNVTGYLNYNDLTGTGPAQEPSTITGGTYTIESTGRVTLTGVTAGEVFNLELYLDGNGDATAASMDTSDVIGGLGYQQTGGPFTASMFNGSYGFNTTGWDKNRLGELDDVGTITANGSGGTFTGTYDLNWLQSSPAEIGDESVSGTFSSYSSGVLTGTITGLDVTTCSTSCTADSFSYYMIDAAGDSIAIETDNLQLTLGYFFQAQP